MSGASTTASRLPEGFESLEPYVDAWAIDTARGRVQRRLESGAEERVAFYEAAKDLLPAGLAFLDRKPLASLDEREKRLMSLFLTLAHISIAVEVQGDDEPIHAEGARHLHITRATSDL